MTIALNGPPSSAVTVAVGVQPDSLLSPSADSLVFDPSDWSKPQALTLQAQGGQGFPVKESVTLSERTLASATLEVTIVDRIDLGTGGESAAVGDGGATGSGGVRSSAAGAPDDTSGAEGVRADGGVGGAAPANDDGDNQNGSGCSCRMPVAGYTSPNQLAFGLLLLLVRRRSRRQPARA